MFGRDSELTDAGAALDAAARGEGRFFLVSGEAGIGKTAYARAVADMATARGFAVSWARGWDGQGAPAYWPFIQIFRSLLRDHAAVAKAALPPERAAKIGELVPEIAAGSEPIAGAAADAMRRFALFDAAAGWLRDLAAQQPLLLVLDDLHAMDPSSLSMFVFVVRELRGARVMMLACQRDHEPYGLEVEVELAKLVREGTRVSLARLERDAVSKMVEAIQGPLPVPIADLVYRTSEGVPLFVEEVLRSMSTPGAAWMSGAPLPAGVRSVMVDRLARLDESTRRVLEIASVVGRSFTLGLVSLLASELDVDLHDVVERAVQAGIVERAAPGRYSFAHAMLREALYRDIPGGPRAKLHARVVEAFDAGKSEHTPIEHAHHALRAAPVIGVHRAVTSARAAADAATKVHAFEDAAEVLRRALAVLDLAPADEQLRAEVAGALARARAGADANAPKTEVVPASVPPVEEALVKLTPEGELWEVRLGRAIVRLKDSRGLQMLAKLVERPGEEIHALVLSSGSAESAATAGDAGEVLDREAVAAYRERLLEVEEELREAEAWNDAARIDRARSEAEFLRAELSRAVGLGGRSRRASADAERARVNCQRRIRDAIRRIAEANEVIGRHLLRAVRTGVYCAYVPEQAR